MWQEYRGHKYVSNGSYGVGTVNSVQWYGDNALHLTDGYSITIVYPDNKITLELAKSYLNKNLLDL